MKIHYIEDNAQDAALFSRMIRERGDVELTVSPRVDEFENSGDGSRTEFILLDVHRPDSVSLEDDIARIRKFSNAPIMVLTSDQSDGLRQEAMEGGAVGLVDKNSVDANVLQQFALNFALRHQLSHTGDIAGSNDEPALKSEEIKAPLASLVGTFSYLESSLQLLHEAMEDSGRENSADYVKHLIETVGALHAYARDDLTKSTRAPIHELLVDTANRISKEAMSRKIDLVMKTENSWFTQIGSKPLAALGLNHLIDGLMRSCQAGDRISLRSEREENGISLNLFLSRAIVSNAEELFNLEHATPSMGFDAKASVQLGLTLLTVTQEQVDVHTHRNNLFIKIQM